MPQNKPPLRFYSEAHAVYGQVERHFRNQKIELLPDWQALVACACFPSQVAEKPLYTNNEGQPVGSWKAVPLKEQWQAVTNCFASQPDLTLQILAFARQCVNHYDESKCATQDGVVRAFLLKYGTTGLIRKANGTFRKWTIDEAPKFAGLNFVPVQKMTDGEIAAYLTRPGLSITKDTVKKVRQSLSIKIVKRSFTVIPVNQLTDAEFAPYVETDAPITPDILEELRLLTPFIRVPTDGLEHERTKKGFKLVLVNQLKIHELTNAFKPARIMPGALQGLKLCDAYIRLPIKYRIAKGSTSRKKIPLNQ